MALGFALIYALRREWSTGLGVALVLASGIGLAVDSVAERRAHPYVAALEQLARDSAR